MIRFIAVALAVTVLSFVLAQHVAFGQTATPTPTTTVPTSAPATGFGPN